MLVGGRYDSANPTLQALQFEFVLPPSSGVPTPTNGPYDANVMVTLPNNCQAIRVINSPNVLGGGVTVEIPFELVYFLSP